MQPTSNQPSNQPIFSHLDENHLEANHLGNHSLTVEALENEIQEVQTMLIASTSDLPTLLGDLVRAQIRRSQPPLCGAVVLTVSNLENRKDGDFHRKRILLASALEMLHVALNVHRLLVNAAARVAQGEQEAVNGSELDRTLIGSTILAGDYCFSRAAQMAAQTDNPRVVATFSLALQSVSEELLREQFSPLDEQNHYDEMGQLLQSGAQAAAQLADLSTWQEQEAMAHSQELATQWNLYQRRNVSTDEQMFASVSANIPHKWQILYRWLTLNF